MAFTDTGVISRLPYPPNPDEVATILAAGHQYADWESVFVQHRWTDAFAWFRFTSVERERDPPSFGWQTLRLKPPDPGGRGGQWSSGLPWNVRKLATLNV
jgi:hypothetical protein